MDKIKEFDDLLALYITLGGKAKFGVELPVEGPYHNIEAIYEVLNEDDQMDTESMRIVNAAAAKIEELYEEEELLVASERAPRIVGVIVVEPQQKPMVKLTKCERIVGGVVAVSVVTLFFVGLGTVCNKLFGKKD